MLPGEYDVVCDKSRTVHFVYEKEREHSISIQCTEVTVTPYFRFPGKVPVLYCYDMRVHGH
jgi:hypothetical protein